MIDHWPLMGLRLTIGDVELRLPDDQELAQLADVAARGVHAPGDRPFLNAWTDGTPAEAARRFVQRHWGHRAEWTPQRWELELAVFHDGRPVGCQGMWASDFATVREVTTGSWLGMEHHGQGIGTRMRGAVLGLAFAGLGSEFAMSMSFEDNHAPLGVSRKFGYRPDGITRDALHGKVMVSRRLRLSRQDWESGNPEPVMITGLDPCRELFGLTGD